MIIKMFRAIFNSGTSSFTITKLPALESASATEEIKKNAAILEEKRQAAIKYLGSKWILHPVHSVKKSALTKTGIKHEHG